MERKKSFDKFMKKIIAVLFIAIFMTFLFFVYNLMLFKKYQKEKKFDLAHEKALNLLFISKNAYEYEMKYILALTLSNKYKSFIKNVSFIDSQKDFKSMSLENQIDSFYSEILKIHTLKQRFYEWYVKSNYLQKLYKRIGEIGIPDNFIFIGFTQVGEFDFGEESRDFPILQKNKIDYISFLYGDFNSREARNFYLSCYFKFQYKPNIKSNIQTANINVESKIQYLNRVNVPKGIKKNGFKIIHLEQLKNIVIGKGFNYINFNHMVAPFGEKQNIENIMFKKLKETEGILNKKFLNHVNEKILNSIYMNSKITAVKLLPSIKRKYFKSKSLYVYFSNIKFNSVHKILETINQLKYCSIISLHHLNVIAPEKNKSFDASNLNYDLQIVIDFYSNSKL